MWRVGESVLNVDEDVFRRTFERLDAANFEIPLLYKRFSGNNIEKPQSLISTVPGSEFA